MFTLFAYLNGPAGWSEENGDTFSPQRAQLRADLQARLAELDPKLVERWRNFYEQHKQISYRYRPHLDTRCAAGFQLTSSP